MKEADSKLEPWSDGELRRIHIDYDYTYTDWWKTDSDPGYNYVRDKSNDSYYADGYICQYFDGDIEAFVGSTLCALQEDKYGFFKYDRYVEMIEFGWDDTCSISMSYIIDYFIKYARYVGAKFIRIPNKEDFPKFYSKITWWVDEAYENDCYIISIDNPIVYDEYIHIKHYDTDLVTVEDLYFLHYIGYEVGRDACVYKHYSGDEISIDRRTGAITFPSYIWHEGDEPTILSPRYYPHLCLFSNYYTPIKAHTLVYDIKIDGVDYDLARIGNEQLVIFHDISVEDNMFDTLYKISKATSFEKYTVFTASLNIESLFSKYSYCDRRISSDLYYSSLCLEFDGCVVYPPHKKKLADRDFNERLSKIKSLGLIIEGESQLSEAYVFFDHSYARAVYKNKEFELNKIDKQKVANTLFMAHFGIWEKEYTGDMNLFWGITLELEDETLSFRGNGGAPKIWMYLVNDLIEGLGLNEI